MLKSDAKSLLSVYIRALLAIFFWIMPGGLSQQGCSHATCWPCYFLLNYANQVPCPENLREILELAIFFWIMRTSTLALELYNKLRCLLFSFELCRLRASRPLRMSLPSLAIFFWIMPNIVELKRFIEKCPEIRSWPCYFLLNYARASPPLSEVARQPPLAIFFWIMQSRCTGSPRGWRL